MNVDRLWQIVLDRDASADGSFVYAVASTRIYCRPSCASRRPRRERVEFYPDPAMAEAHGYRACLRCQPRRETVGNPREERLIRACQAIAASPQAKWTTAKVARAAKSSVPQIQRAFRAVLGMAARDYVAACRRRRFLDDVRQGGRVTDAIYAAGYGSSSRVYGAIRLPGMTPATYGRGGRGTTIDWLVANSRVGRVLVAATAKGLCFVEVGPDQATLLSALREEFPQAAISPRPSSRLESMMGAAQAIVAAEPVKSQIPVDIRGTAFQWRVWHALTRIPAGETISYGQLAKGIGKPSSVRAVARACATNPLSLVVPCHRVVSATGALTGYRWGVGVKERLIAAERKG
jgi:AraC family transcriptional regulator of adaptative response/methylated-DNA-[protein]-cysteine methyltransferase